MNTKKKIKKSPDHVHTYEKHKVRFICFSLFFVKSNIRPLQSVESSSSLKITLITLVNTENMLTNVGICHRTKLNYSLAAFSFKLFEFRAVYFSLKPPAVTEESERNFRVITFPGKNQKVSQGATKNQQSHF